jgi:small-conductance mechanosensitive channel
MTANPLPLLPQIGEVVAARLLQITLTLILAFITLHAAHLIRRRLRHRIESAAFAPARRPRLLTLIDAAFNIVRVIILGVAALMVLGEVGVNLTPVLASVGVVALAVSLGAQTLIKDFIGGALVLVEDLFDVGDTVQIGVMTGTVEQITLRATYLRDGDGRLIVIPNGDVRTVANASQDWARASIDLSFALSTDLDRVRAALQAAIDATRSDPEIAPLLLEEPQIIPWHNLNERAVQFRLVVRTRPTKQDTVVRALRRNALASLSAAGISLSAP